MEKNHPISDEPQPCKAVVSPSAVRSALTAIAIGAGIVGLTATLSGCGGVPSNQKLLGAPLARTLADNPSAQTQPSVTSQPAAPEQERSPK